MQIITEGRALSFGLEAYQKAKEGFFVPVGGSSDPSLYLAYRTVLYGKVGCWFYLTRHICDHAW